MSADKIKGIMLQLIWHTIYMEKNIVWLVAVVAQNSKVLADIDDDIFFIHFFYLTANWSGTLLIFRWF